MSELEKAKQELEQVCFAYHKAGGTGDIKDWKYFYDLENKLIEKVKIANQPQLTIPKNIADELEEEIEEAYSNDYIRSYSDVGAYMEVITDGLDEDSELYKFMFPANDALLGCSHRNIIYLYMVDNDLVKAVEGWKKKILIKSILSVQR